MPRSTDGTKTRSTHWPESDSLNAMPELRARGRELERDFGELPCAAGLLLVPIRVLGAALNRLAIRHARLDEVEMNVEPPPQTLGDHFEMHLALRGNDRLVQLGIDAKNKGRIFVVQRREARGHFVLFALRLELQRGVNVRPRIFRHGKLHRMIRGAKRVAGMRVLEFHRRANVARTETRRLLARLAVEQKNLPDAFRGVAAGVEQIAAGPDLPGIDPEERKLAEVFFVHRLEHLQHRLGAADFHFHRGAAARVFCIHLLAIERRGTVFRDEVEQAPDADVRRGRGAEERDELLRLHRRVNARAKFLLRQRALLEKFVEQRVVRFRDQFDQLTMQLRRRAPSIRPSPAPRGTSRARRFHRSRLRCARHRAPG